jgi:hypothetical protein
MVKKFNGKLIDDTTYPFYVTSIYRMNQNTERNYLTSEFSSRNSMEGFLRSVASMRDVSANVISTYTSQMDDLKNRLDDKLVKAARIQAAKLAQLSGRKLGNILVLTEATAGDSNPLQTIFDLIKLDAMNVKLAQDYFPDKVKLEKSLKVRFAW